MNYENLSFENSFKHLNRRSLHGDDDGVLW